MLYLMIPSDSLRNIRVSCEDGAFATVEIEALSKGIGTMDIVESEVTPYPINERRYLTDGFISR